MRAMPKPAWPFFYTARETVLYLSINPRISAMTRMGGIT